MKSPVLYFPALVAVLVGLAVVGWSVGCNATGSAREASAEDQSDNSETTDGGDTQPAEDEVVVKFINLSDVVVDPEFYATNDALDDPGDELFVPAYRIQTGIGLAATSRLASGESDEITYPCTETTLLGTAGGKYLDPELGTTLATGQLRWVEVEINFDCGNRIIFTYRGENGTYTTEPPLVDFTD